MIHQKDRPFVFIDIFTSWQCSEFTIEKPGSMVSPPTLLY